MIFIHHHGDSECEEMPPPKIRRIAYLVADEGGPAVHNARGFVSATNALFENVRSTPDDCGPDFWEFVIEDTDLWVSKMTKSTTDTPILDDDAVGKIEARASAATELPGEGSTVRVIYDHGGGRMYVQRNAERDLILDSYNRGDSEFYFHARADVLSLCATVRALRAEKREHEHLLDLANKYSVEVAGKPRDLQSQLEQVTKERDDLRQQLQGEQALDLITERGLKPHVRKVLDEAREHLK